MRKMISVLALCVATTPAAIAAPSHISRDGRGGYDVTYDYKDKAKTGWYISGRAEASFLNWKNKYSAPAEYELSKDYTEESFSFEPVFGGSLAVGKRFNYFWRAELEGGYIGYFNDADEGYDFSISIPYLTANIYYDFNSGLYLGAGAGATMVTTHMDADIFSDTGNSKENAFGGMGALMLGYSKKLDDNLVLDVRYRFAGILANSEHTRHVSGVRDGEEVEFDLTNKINFIMDNSISIGIRYEF